MENITNVAVLIRKKQDLFEGLRSTLGLAVENFFVSMIVIDVEVQASDTYKEYLEWLDELECEYYSNNKADEKHGFKYIDIEAIGEKTKTMDLVINL